MDAIDQRCREIVEIVCKLEKQLPLTFMDIQMHLLIHIQMHLLIHLVDDIDMASVMSAKNIFFVERILKVLKGFVRQH